MVDPLPLGSRWELFMEIDDLDAHIDSVIEQPIIKAKSKTFGALTGIIEKNVFSLLLFKKAKLTSAFPFYYNTQCFLKTKVDKIQTTRYGDAFLTLNIDGEQINATSVDYSFNQKAYSKNMKLYFTAISYTISKIDLKSKLARAFIKTNSGFPDEYTFTGNITQNMGSNFLIKPLNSGFPALPVLAKEIYLHKPKPGQNASGDIWLTCFSENFSVKLESSMGA